MRTVAALRPPRLYSVLSTTIGSLPFMITLPARISCAIFMGAFEAFDAFDASSAFRLTPDRGLQV
jgi:hypothetical protein